MMDKTIIFGLLLFLVIGCTNNVVGEAQYVPVEEVYTTCGDKTCDPGETLTCTDDCAEPVKEIELVQEMVDTVEITDDDFDGDGLPNTEETEVYYTNPYNPDTDEDGLSDYEEINVYKTDPTEQDTDRDSIKDNIEVKEGTNPLNIDTDSDGRSDLEEEQDGTNPLNPDTDGDDLDDGMEHTYGSNPKDTDSDNDCLTDGAEVNIHYTSPTLANVDPDGDDVTTCDEITLGTLPFNPDSDEDGYPDNVDSDPLDNTVYMTALFAPRSNAVTALTLDGTELWSTDIDNVLSSVVTGNGEVFVGNTDTLYSLSQGTGDIVWSQTIGKEVTGLAYHDLIVYAVAENALYAYDTRSGNLVWNYEIGQGLHKNNAADPIIHEGHVYPQTNYVAKVTLEDGYEKWNVNTDSPHGVTLVVEDKVYVPSGNNLLVIDDITGEVEYTLSADVTPNSQGSVPCQEVGAVHYNDDTLYVLWTETGMTRYCDTELVLYSDGTETASYSVSEIVDTTTAVKGSSTIVDNGNIMFTATTSDASYLITLPDSYIEISSVQYGAMIEHNGYVYMSHDNGNVAAYKNERVWETEFEYGPVYGTPAVN